MRLGMRPRAPFPSEIHLRTPRRVTFCKRRGTLLNKVSELCGLTGDRAAVIVLSSTGRLYFSSGSPVEEMEETFFDDVRCNGGAMPPMGPKVGLEWIKKRRQRPEIAKIPDRGAAQELLK
ncbi:hypothetical protein NL676_029170 [Syzygium grande]|nr:hypothetical protein NL676_029170 [Syzygium grande]